MLLVKSRESKSSGSKYPYKSWAYCLFGLPLAASFEAAAQAPKLGNSASYVSIFLSLLLVIGIVFMLGYLMRRFNVTSSSGGQLKVVASMVAGTRERVVVIQVGEEQHLLGVTSHNINHLAKLDTPLAENKSSTGQDFKQKFTQALAEKINPNLAKQDQQQSTEQGDKA